jgi:hypothetical protein
MATEVLSVPEEKLGEVIRVIRAGLHAKPPRVSAETAKRLRTWCSEEEEYLRESFSKDFWP